MFLADYRGLITGLALFDDRSPSLVARALTDSHASADWTDAYSDTGFFRCCSSRSQREAGCHKNKSDSHRSVPHKLPDG
jgi:hypothetical protein